jgi:hypothetical protein
MSKVTCPACQGTLVTLVDDSSGRRYTQCLNCWRITYIDMVEYTYFTTSNTVANPEVSP